MTGLRLDTEEAWQVIEASHTGILTTLRRDGWPIALPVWFVVLDGAIYLTTPAATKKVARIKHDQRGSFLVESGEAWKELRAVVVPVTASLVEDAPLGEAIEHAVEEKYAAFRIPASEMPSRTAQYYVQQVAVIRLVPAGRFVTWDNSRLFPPTA